MANVLSVYANLLDKLILLFCGWLVNALIYASMIVIPGMCLLFFLWKRSLTDPRYEKIMSGAISVMLFLLAIVVTFTGVAFPVWIVKF